MISRQQQSPSYGSQSSYSSTYSEASEYSRSTAPTDYSDRPTEVRNLKHPDIASGYLEEPTESNLRQENDARSSVVTYASTIPSENDLPSSGTFEVPVDRQQTFPSTSFPSTPQEFAQLFPSNRRLLIRHDDSTLDGNMNLCIDTEIAEPRAKIRRITLFHLRLKDLRDRQASLRRYCRDSGREVCHSSRQTQFHMVPKRPGIQRSLSSALQTIGLNSLAYKAQPEMKRSNTYDVSDTEGQYESNTAKTNLASQRLDKAIHLEYSNYAHVNLNGSRSKSSKRYDFEYWGVKYHWKREVRREGDFAETSYHLMNTSTSSVIAHIMPEHLTKREAMEEEYRGGWIPPSSLWISDKRIPKGPSDLAE